MREFTVIGSRAVSFLEEAVVVGDRNVNKTLSV